MNNSRKILQKATGRHLDFSPLSPGWYFWNRPLKAHPLDPRLCPESRFPNFWPFKLDLPEVLYVTRQLGNTVVNLSGMEFDSEQISVLELGPKFIPAPKVISKIPILEASNKFARTLKLKYHFRNSKFNSKKLFEKPGTFLPSDRNMPPIVLE